MLYLTTFLYIHLKIVYSCFTKSKLNSSHRYNPWIIRGIKLSCQNKRNLCMSCRESNDTNLKLRYKRYCKILTDAIKTEKKKMNSYLNPGIKQMLHGKLKKSNRK